MSLGRGKSKKMFAIKIGIEYNISLSLRETITVWKLKIRYFLRNQQLFVKNIAGNLKIGDFCLFGDLAIFHVNCYITY